MMPADEMRRSEHLLATATQFPERERDSKLRAFGLLLVVAGSTLLVGAIAATLVVVPFAVLVMVTIAISESVYTSADIVPLCFALIVGAGLASALLYLPVLVWTWARGGDLVLHAGITRVDDRLAAQTVRDIADELAVAVGIPPLETVFIDRSAPNALAFGRDSRNATIALTPSLVTLLTRQQLQAVVAHELAHVVNGDIRFKTFLAAILIRYDLMIDALRPSADHGTMPLDPLDPASTDVLGWLAGRLSLALMACRAIAIRSSRAASRRRELLADYTTVRITRDPKALAEAIVTVDAENPGGFASRVDPLAHLFIVDPSGGDPRRSGHPDLSERLYRLERLVEEMGTLD